jgi:hypothetical protein
VLVVGNQDAGKLQGYKLSSKRKKAEELIKVGHPIQIVTEADVFVLVGDSAYHRFDAELTILIEISEGRTTCRLRM